MDRQHQKGISPFGKHPPLSVNVEMIWMICHTSASSHSRQGLGERAERGNTSDLTASFIDSGIGREVEIDEGS